MFTLPLAAAITQAASLISSKYGLTKRRIPYHTYVPVLMLYITVLSLLLWPSLGYVSPDLTRDHHNLAKLSLMIGAALWWISMFYRGLQQEKANVAESIGNFVPIATILVAWTLTPATFDPLVAGVATVGTFALLWGFWDKKGLRLNGYLAGSAVLIALENVLAAQLLQAGLASPLSLYAIRSGIIFGVFYLKYRPPLLRLKLATHWLLLWSAAIGGGFVLLQYYALRDSGVYITSLLLILAPVFAYVASSWLLHEKLKRRQMMAVIILLGCVLFVTFHR